MSAATLAIRLTPAFPWLIVACGLLTIAHLSGGVDVPWVGGTLKALTMLLIALRALRLPSDDAWRRRRVLTALSCSVLGEFAMVVPGGTVAGLSLFAVAQACYLTVVCRRIGLVRPGLMHLLHAVAVAWALAMWSAQPPAIFASIIAFMCLLGLMSPQADTWWWRARGTPEEAPARCAAIGGFCWIAADLVWTYSNCVAWIPGTYLCVLPLYWLAQWNLASIIGARAQAADD